VSAMTNEEVVRTACQVIWTDGDVSRVSEFYGEGFKADYPMTDWGRGLEGVEALARSVRESFPDYREQIDELFVDGDNVIVRLTIRGTHEGPLMNVLPTGKAVEFRDVTICRVADGKIVEQRGLSDHLSVMVQLGVIELPGA
jgi:predicted ester cyclase